MKLLDIGEVAAKSGLQPSALRHYEEAGLIAPVARHGLRRQFEPQVLMQLKLIAMGKSAGFLARRHRRACSVGTGCSCPDPPCTSEPTRSTGRSAS